MRHRKTMLLTGLIVATCLLSWIVGLPGVGGVKQFREAGVIAAQPGGVELRADTSRVRIRPSTDGKIHVSARGEYAGARPLLALTTDGGSVLVVVDCFAEPTRKCDLAVDLQVPPDASLRAKTSSGTLDVAGLAATSSLRSDSGPLILNNLTGSVIVETLSGTTRGADLSGRRYTVTSRTGSVSLALTRVPASVKIDSGRGQTSLVVPPATYRVSASSGGASSNIGVPSSATAFPQLSLTSSDAPIRVRTPSAQNP